jgi:hypothetical protein
MCSYVGFGVVPVELAQFAYYAVSSRGKTRFIRLTQTMAMRKAKDLPPNLMNKDDFRAWCVVLRQVRGAGDAIRLRIVLEIAKRSTGGLDTRHYAKHHAKPRVHNPCVT